MKLTPTERIEKDLADLTPQELERVDTQFTAVEPQEEVLCVIRGERAIRLWALSLKYNLAMSKIDVQRAETNDTRTLARLAAEGQRYSALEDLTRDMAWFEAREEAGDKAWSAASIGLREGFSLVVPTKEKIREMTLGRIALPLEALREIAGMGRTILREMQQGHPRVKGPKPQEPS